MQSTKWMLLTDYSNKYKISISTLRRRIKAKQIRFRLDGGKYYLLDSHYPDRSEVAVYKETLTFPGIQSAREAKLREEIEITEDLKEASTTPLSDGSMPETHLQDSNKAQSGGWSSETEGVEVLFADAGTNAADHTAGEIGITDSAISPSPGVPKNTENEYLAEPAGEMHQQNQTREAGATSSSSASQAILQELKAAYMSILQEKEEQIANLKYDLSEIRTQVQLLEDENEWMRKLLVGQAT